MLSEDQNDPCIRDGFRGDRFEHTSSTLRGRTVQGEGIRFAFAAHGDRYFPSLNLPVIYVCQPYGGMDPAQMEGLLTNYYEYHFLYINGIHHVESRNVQGTALMKLIFHPGTNMAQAMAETINYVNRSRAMMPPGTVPPFVMRFDTGSVPVGYLVLSSGTKTVSEIQDQALFKVRPMFSSLRVYQLRPPLVDRLEALWFVPNLSDCGPMAFRQTK